MITLYTAECRQNNKNCFYPHRIEVTDEESLKKAVSKDYTCAEFKGNRRSIDNFIQADCVGFDVDNDFSDVPAEWILPHDIAEFFSGTTFWIHYSRSNMREKNGKEARPKFHVMFPIAPCNSAEKYAAMKQAVQKMFPYFDAQALDPARFFFGTEDPEVEYWEGVRDLTGFLEKRGGVARDVCTAIARERPQAPCKRATERSEALSESQGTTGCLAMNDLSELSNDKRDVEMGYVFSELHKSSRNEGWEDALSELRNDKRAGAIDNYSRIPQGQRNNTMHRFALKTLKRYGKTEKALKLYLKDAERCDPPLPTDELRNTWQSAVKFYERTIAQAPDYIPPEEYGRAPAALSLKPPDYSDIGQAKVLVREYADELCYTESTDYLRYDGRCWRESKQRAVGAVEEFLDLQLADAEDEIASAVKELTDIGGVEFDLSDGTRGLSRQFKAFDDEEKLQALERAKEKLANAFLYKAFVMKRRDMNFILSALAAAKPMVQKEVADLDKDPFLLNTPDATYDLRYGMAGVQAQEPRNYITKITMFNPSEKGMEIWLKALDTFFCGDEELIAYVQMIVGLAAVGKVFLEAIIIAYGEGRNGKSTFWNTVARVLGTYSGQMSADTLTVGIKRNVKPEMAELKGKRLVIAAELEEGMRLNTSMIKQLCSTDEIFAEKKYRDPFKFIPSHTLVLYTNHLPKVGASDAGTWRRLIVIPFNAKIEGSSDVKNYTDYLVQNAGEAVMQWIIEGAEKVIAREFCIPVPECVKNAITAYRDNNDWLSNFLSECCEVGQDYKAKSGTIYQEYRDYCMRNGEWARNTSDFYTALEQAGYERKRKPDANYLMGLQLKPASNPYTGY